ncbi:ATP-dependent DNA helicase UvrD2 [Glutamicibacter sp. JL.03c]|uniref:ATP-dependent DNA helicase UvrD2 n=1 Tax=Glutamicibacter sp. JL.03c TaxID=2984842 RepID=UPI0021F6B12B|nr:ATP-dependent DNA helicase UvrD2 [Glutamicibacter sp. JL.03c]UYQ76423.1 ATP-dependent DNA helicase UvrD2 [Glutamicibacter sp. JL.03c]
MTEHDAPPVQDLLGGLDAEQRQAAETLSGPLCILAGAGTGKTRAITHRIAHGVHTGIYNPTSVLALTFTTRAAAEMRTRLRQLGAPGVQARTFHAAALRQLQYFWPQAIGGTLPNLVEHKAPLIAEAARRLRISSDRAMVRDLAAEIEWAKVSMHTPESYAKIAATREMPNGLEPVSMARIFQTYEELKDDRGVIDFEDVLLLTIAILEDNEKVAAHVRQQYRHFVVDEYQDVSPLQQRLLDLWLGQRNELCVVGDASQTIYSFTGARPDFLLNFGTRFPEARVVKLVRDYRSTPEVVNLANKVLSTRRIESSVPDRDVTWPEPLELIAQRDHGPSPEFFETKDDENEAEEVAQRIKKLMGEGQDLSEIAILYRTNGQSQAFEQALSAHSIPYVMRGAERFFSRREVKEGMLALRAALSVAAETSVSQLVRDVLSSHGYSANAPSGGTGAVRQRWESLSALVRLADEVVALKTEQGTEATLHDVVRELEDRAAIQHAPTLDGITLASFHAAKGLEWDAVFLVGLSEGLVPISYAKDQAGFDEERRLLYVGITRARKHLFLSWSLARTPGGRAHRYPSRFLDGIKSVRQASSRQQTTYKKREQKLIPAICTNCGSFLTSAKERKLKRCASCPAAYDEALFDSLRNWRSEIAHSNSVPAFVIFTDATLMSIAEHQPESLQGLSKIAGVGRSKLERYGEAILAVLGSYRG